MDGALTGLADDYRSRHGDSVTSKSRLSALYRHYVKRSEDSILEGVAAAAAINGLFLADQVDLDAVTPEMERAFHLAYPGRDLEQRLSEVNGLSSESPEFMGFISSWKGKYFEVWAEERLNAGESIGGISLASGQSAVLAEDLNQPGFDLQILNSDGSVDTALQLKATESIGYVKEAIEKYPEYVVVTLGEATGITNDQLNEHILAPTEALMDSPLEELAESVLPFLPVVVILGSEGVPLLMGRKTLERAARGMVERSVKSGTAIGAGALAVAAGSGFFGLPVAFFTRLGIDRVFVHRRLINRIRTQNERLALIDRSA